MFDFPVIIRERKVGDLIVRAETPVLDIENVIAVLCIMSGDQRVGITTEKDLTDEVVFEQIAEAIAAEVDYLHINGGFLTDDWLRKFLSYT